VQIELASQSDAKEGCARPHHVKIKDTAHSVDSEMLEVRSTFNGIILSVVAGAAIWLVIAKLIVTGLG
jgi:hypothetical protein